MLKNCWKVLSSAKLKNVCILLSCEPHSNRQSPYRARFGATTRKKVPECRSAEHFVGRLWAWERHAVQLGCPCSEARTPG